MGKKLEANGMWESSRMMLPEHREALLEQNRELKRNVKPTLDEQATEEFTQLIHQSYETGKIIKVTVYDPFEDIQVTGQVIQIDPHKQRLLFFHGYQKTWIPFEDIISVDGSP